MKKINLSWGLHPMQESYFLLKKTENEKLVIARVIFASTDHYRILVLGECQDRVAKLRGHFFNHQQERPVVGDWVCVIVEPGDHQAIPIESLLPRRTEFRKFDEGSQSLIANVDKVALVTSFNQDFNLRRLERGLAMIQDSRAEPLIVVNKMDLVDQKERNDRCQQLSDRLKGVSVVICSAQSRQGVDQLIQLMSSGQVIALVGMSGVGKSTLINQLLDRTQQITNEIRSEDSRGRHTTTNREMFQTHHGFWIIDTPGTRQFSVASENQSLEESFEDLFKVSLACRFRDCTHHSEPGCEVQKAIQSGLISEDRWRNYLKIQREIARQGQKENKQMRSLQKKKMIKRQKELKQVLKLKRGRERN